MIELELDEFSDYDSEINQQEILDYLHSSWEIGYQPNVSKMLRELNIDSVSVLEFFDILVDLRNACQLSYYKEWNCVRIISYDSRLLNTSAVDMKEDLFEFYDSDPLVMKNE